MPLLAALALLAPPACDDPEQATIAGANPAPPASAGASASAGGGGPTLPSGVGGEGGRAASSGGASGSAGGSGRGGEAGASPAPACRLFPYAFEACGACAETRCCEQLASCRDSTACLAVEGCLADCDRGDASCRVSCDNTPWRPDEVGSSLGACLASQCTDECAISCGGVLFATDACDSCARASCCDQMTACGADDACRSLDACLRLCRDDDPPCPGACLARFGGAEASREAMRSCINDTCGKLCTDGVAKPP